MNLPPIVQTGDPVLRSRALELPAEQINTPEVQRLIDVMVAVMRAAPGVGLAAPQIGIPLRIIVLEDQPERAGLTDEEQDERGRVGFALKVFINPELKLLGTATATFYEGCLSVDGFAALVERRLEAEITGLDRHGAPQTWRVSGWPARILQHEVDHLEGTLYIDRMQSRTFTHGNQEPSPFEGLSVAEILKTFAP